MEIFVNENLQKFNIVLSKKGWEEVEGHEVKIGDFTFCAIEIPNPILGGTLTNVTEVTSGTRLTVIHNPQSVDKLEFYKTIVAKEIVRIVKNNPNLNEKIAEMKERTFRKYGANPMLAIKLNQKPKE